MSFYSVAVHCSGGNKYSKLYCSRHRCLYTQVHTLYYFTHVSCSLSQTFVIPLSWQNWSKKFPPAVKFLHCHLSPALLLFTNLINKKHYHQHHQNHHHLHHHHRCRRRRPYPQNVFAVFGGFWWSHLLFYYGLCHPPPPSPHHHNQHRHPLPLPPPHQRHPHQHCHRWQHEHRHQHEYLP